MEGSVENMAYDRWIQVKAHMFEDSKLKIINSMEQRDLINYVWLRSMLLAGVSNRNGYLYINDNIPYTLKTLAIEFGRTLEEIKLSYKVLRSLEMIVVTEEGIYKIKNWERHQNTEGLEKIRKQNAERVARYRERKKAQLTDETETKSGSQHNIEDENFTDSQSIDNSDYRDTDCNVTGNVTDEDINVTVMVQNKKKNKIEKKNKNKNKIKREIENETDSGISSGNDVEKLCGYKKAQSNDKEESKDFIEHNNITELENCSEKLVEYLRIMSNGNSSMNGASIKYAVTVHGEEYVKLAMEKAFAAGKPTINYINGILKNWQAEGYPKSCEGVKNSGGFFNGKDSGTDKDKYAEIKRTKCRALTDGERKQAECVLI